jgi:hypothetical protein
VVGVQAKQFAPHTLRCSLGELAWIQGLLNGVPATTYSHTISHACMHAVLEAPSQIPGLNDGPAAEESNSSSTGSKAINWFQQW